MSDQPEDKAAAQRSSDPRETNVARVMTSTSVQKHRTAFASTRLPILDTALDVEHMTELLGPLLAPLASSAAPAVSYARLVAYKQGNRGLIQYDVSGTDSGESCAVFGKIFPDLSQATRVYNTMHALWADVFGDATQIGVPRPLGCVPELAMLVYIPAEGELLGDVIAGDRALHYMQLAGQWLGTLHSHRFPLDRRFQMSTELVNLQTWANLIGQKYPDEADNAERIVAHLKSRVGELTFASDVPIHKDFHYGHILVNGTLKIIDFDEMRLGDPNFDVAHFCANLHLLAYRYNTLAFTFSTLQSAFLNAYARVAGWAPNERVLFFYAYTCLKIAKQLCSGRGLRPRPEGDEQRRQVRLMMEQGLDSLPNDPTKRLAGGFATVMLKTST